MNNSLVSIIIPCYNQAEYLNTTISSVFKQLHKNWECILVNDGSTDNTQNIIDEWVKKDSRFISITQKNAGLSNARNTGLKKAKGNWIQFLDSDDYLDEEKFTLSIQQGKDIVISDFLMFSGSPKNTSSAYCKLQKQNFSFQSVLLNWDIKYTIPIHCGFFSKKIVEGVFFDEKIKAKEDWIFWLSVFNKNPTKVFLPKRLALYRKHNKSMTQKTAFMFKNTIGAYKIIYKTILNKEVDRTLFFERIIDEYAKHKTSYLDIASSKDVFKKLEECSKIKKKYYNVWYRKYFYKIFKPKKFKDLHV